MTLREQFAQSFPGQIFLDPNDLPSLEDWLAVRGWIEPGERLISANRAGEGNMNCTLRVETNARSFILKQARPWVEKYPAIPAPPERAAIEAAFYRTTAANARVSSLMPRLLASAPEASLLMLEDLTPASDLTDIYTRSVIGDEDLTLLIEWLRALHTGFRDASLADCFENPAMRRLNHAHIFDLPLRSDNGWDCDRWTPGLAAQATALQSDARYCSRVNALGKLYLGAGECLVHGDYFPGSWMRAQGSVRVIDPEFCFRGRPEFDFGVFVAHLYLAGMPGRTVDLVLAGCRSSDLALVRGFAGVEIMRRLIGVAQLPLPYCIDLKARLLEQSREMVLSS